MSDAFVCKANGLQYCTRKSFLLETDVLRVEENLGYLESLLVKRNILRVYVYLEYLVLSSSMSTA